MKNIKNFLALLLTPLLLVSCLKDDLNNLDPKTGTNNVIEFKNISQIASAASSKYPLYIAAFDLADSYDLPVVVNYAGAESTAPKDITVTLAVDPTLVAAYNTDQSDDLVALPNSLYTPTLSVVIPKGQRTGTAIFNIKPNQFDLSKRYALGLKITAVSSGIISGNFSSIIVNTIAKNKFDGTYNFKTSSVTSLQPNKDATVELQTVGATRLQLIPGLLATYGNAVYYNIDLTTNAITVECPSLGVQIPQDPRSKYDPATKTLTVFWKQRNGGRTFEEVIKYLGPR